MNPRGYTATNAGNRRTTEIALVSGLDLTETVTNYVGVTELNNKYFAPVWRRISAPGDVFYADYKNPDID